MTRRASLSFGTPASISFNDVTASQAANPTNFKFDYNTKVGISLARMSKITSFSKLYFLGFLD